MDLDEIEDLIRRYLSAGIAVVLLLIAPGGSGEDAAPRNDPAVVTVTPSPGERADLDARASDPGADDEGASAGSGGSATDDEDPATGDTGAAAPRTTPPRPTPAPRTADPAADTDRAGPDRAGPDPTTRGTTGADGSDPDPGGDGPDTGETSSTEPGGTEPGGTESGTGDQPTSDPDPDPTSTDPTDDGATEAAPTRDPVPTTPRDAPPETSAASELGWGTPVQEDDFTSGLSQWELYDGPGHAGQGMRSPAAATVEDGVLTITGDSTGTTAGMCWAQGQRYGRWEGRVRAPASDPSYDALLLLWPDDDSPSGGEIDFMEMQDPTRRTTDFFLHHGADDRQVTGQVEVDATRWHTWAVEWTAEAITGFVDGERWFRTTDTVTFPPGPMHLCVQLDFFPQESGEQGSGPVRESTMQVDWVRRYAAPTG